MNYFTHARESLEEPFYTVGLALPDWMAVVCRRVRLSTRVAEPWCDDDNAEIADMARGIVQHHVDDARFHKTRAFNELSLDFTVRIRDELGSDAGFRPAFLGHILVELLLDATLIARDPGKLDKYYRLLEGISPATIQDYVERMAGKAVANLAHFIRRFTEMRILFDYLDDRRLFLRLNQIMTRVKLSRLPERLLDLLPRARTDVAARAEELLACEQ